MSTKMTPAIATQLMQVKSMTSFTDWLKSALEERKEALMHLSGEPMLRTQGKAQELQAILDAIEKSQEIARKLQKA